MKTISIVVPCYNEEENVQAMADALRETFKKDLPAYRYEIIFIDNDSKDRTREIIRKLCAEDKGEPTQTEIKMFKYAGLYLFEKTEDSLSSKRRGRPLPARSWRNTSSSCVRT